eukprot:scaffold30926_cov62-Phaeocystis_antarctica.AAC.14
MPGEDGRRPSEGMSPGRQLSNAVLSAEGSVSSCHTAPMTPCHRRISEHLGASASCASRSKRLLVPAGPEAATGGGGPALASATLGRRHRATASSYPESTPQRALVVGLEGSPDARGRGFWGGGRAVGAVASPALFSPCCHADAQRALGRHVLDVGDVLDGDTPPGAPEGHQRVRLTRLRLLQ